MQKDDSSLVQYKERNCSTRGYSNPPPYKNGNQATVDLFCISFSILLFFFKFESK